GRRPPPAPRRAKPSRTSGGPADPAPDADVDRWTSVANSLPDEPVWSRKPLQHSQPGTPRAGVFPHLVVPGRQGRRLDGGEPPGIERAERLLDDAVFARMKRDDTEPASGSQELGSLGKRLAKRSGLVVDGHAQRLERAGRDVQATRPRGTRHGAPDHGDELARGPERAPADD